MRNISPIVAIVVLCVSLPLAAAPPSTDFNATVSSRALRPAGPCTDGAFRCGTAIIDGIGDAAAWQFFLGAFAPTSNACGAYTATVVFTLADGSVLELAENGTVCGPGNSFFSTPPFSWGNPDLAAGDWTVVSASGRFAGMTGSGSSRLTSAGALVAGSYRAD